MDQYLLFYWKHKDRIVYTARFSEKFNISEMVDFGRSKTRAGYDWILIKEKTSSNGQYMTHEILKHGYYRVYSLMNSLIFLLLGLSLLFGLYYLYKNFNI